MFIFYNIWNHSEFDSDFVEAPQRSFNQSHGGQLLTVILTNLL
jgi:hypothetical protein